jgi:sortase B
VLLAFGCFALWDTSQLRAEASTVRWEPYRPADDATGADAGRASFEGDAATGAPSFASLRATNPEVIAWLDVYGTNIDYPVTQAESNMKYINTDAMGAYSAAGSLFLDSGSDAAFLDFTSIIYGHHMEGDVFFGGLGRFSDSAYLEEHRYGRLYADGRWQGLEAVAFVHADAYDKAVYRTGDLPRQDRDAYLQTLYARALHVRGNKWPDGVADGRLVLLSTCSPGATNGRDILVCVLSNTVVPDPFAATAAASGAGTSADADSANRQQGAGGTGGAWSLISLICVVLSVIAAVTGAAIRLLARRQGAGSPGQADRQEQTSGGQATDKQTPPGPRRERERDGGQPRERAFVVWVVAVVFGLATLVVWLVFDDVTLPMTLINSGTPLIVAMTVVQAALHLLHARLQKRADRSTPNPRSS